MLGKLAFRNAKRSFRDYLIYLITITISFSLILAFQLVAGAEEVVRLSEGMGSFKDVLTFVNVVIVFVVCFLINYTTRFMFGKRSKELGIYMLLGIKKKKIAALLVTENIFLGMAAFLLAVPLGLVSSQFISLVVVRLLGIPEVIFISLKPAAVGVLALYFLAIYVLVLLNLLRSVRKMTVHDFLYFERQNEKKMFRSSKKRNIIFAASAAAGAVSLLVWNSRCNMEKFSNQETLTYLMVSMSGIIISIYGVSATCADMLLSVILKSKRRKYQKDTLFVTRTFASKVRTMSFTFGTLSMLILLSILCLNFSGINKGVYQTSIELTAPYDVHVFDEKEALDEYAAVVAEDYTIEERVDFDVYKEMNAEIQQYFSIEFYDYDPLMKLSDYNRLRKLRNLAPISLNEDEYFLVTSRELLYKVDDNENIRTIRLSNEKELKQKGIDTQTYWYSMNNTGRFAVIVPDENVRGLEISESHLVLDTKEETRADLQNKIYKDMEHRLVQTDEDGEQEVYYYRVSVRGAAIEEQNTMTAMTASLCLYIAFILISAVGTILAVQSLSDSAKYRYRYLILQKMGVNDRALYGTIRKQLLILFGVPVVYSVVSSFCMLASINNVYQVLLENRFVYLIYFAGSLAVFFLVYGVYWIAAYTGFKRNINGE